MIKPSDMDGYSEQNSVYEQQIASLDELLFEINILWGVRFVGHCLCLNGGGHKVVTLIGVKERPPDNPFHKWAIDIGTKYGGLQNIFGKCHILTKSCHFCFFTQHANGYQNIYGTIQIENGHRYDNNKCEMNVYNLGVELFCKKLRQNERVAKLTNCIVTQNMPKCLTIYKELRHNERVAKLTNCIVNQNMPKCLSIYKEIGHKEGVAKLTPSLVNKYMTQRKRITKHVSESFFPLD